MIWNEYFDSKIRTFQVFEGEDGKKMVLAVGTDMFCTKTVQARNVS